MSAATPLFILGMGRSGTTTAQRVLNAHPSVSLTGEVPLAVLRALFATLDAADKAHAKTREGWLSRKTGFMFDAFGSLSKGGVGAAGRRADALFRGFKEPRLESLFAPLETHFASVGLLPRYVYCARNPFDCWRSYKATSWNSYAEVNRFLADYVKSFEHLQAMRAAAPERVCVLNLDDAIASRDAAKFYSDTLFGFLGLDVPERVARRIGEFAAPERPSQYPPLSSEERAAVEAFGGIARIRAEHFGRP